MPQQSPVILLTRPAEASERFAGQLQNLIGGQAEIVVSPLLRMDPVGRLPDLTDVNGLIFTSANGVRGFVHASDRRDIPVWAVGEATAQAARRAGFRAHAAGRDAKSLISELLSQKPACPLLHVRGEHALGDVAAN